MPAAKPPRKGIRLRVSDIALPPIVSEIDPVAFLRPHRRLRRSLGQKEKGSGVFYYSIPAGLSFRGRPRGRRADSSPSRPAVATVHASEPNGAPRDTDRRRAIASAAVSTPFTYRRHTPSSGRRPGHPASKSADPFT